MRSTHAALESLHPAFLHSDHRMSLNSVDLRRCDGAESRQQGLIRGLTADSGGALIANATITLISPATATAVTRSSNSAGMFVFPAQPVGRYSMEVKADGFPTQVVNAVDVERKHCAINASICGLTVVNRSVTQNKRQ